MSVTEAEMKAAMTAYYEANTIAEYACEAALKRAIEAVHEIRNGGDNCSVEEIKGYVAVGMAINEHPRLGLMIHENDSRKPFLITEGASYLTRDGRKATVNKVGALRATGTIEWSGSALMFVWFSNGKSLHRDDDIVAPWADELGQVAS